VEENNNMEELNEAIMCYIDDLTDIKRNDKVSIEDKIAKLHEMAKFLNQERDYIYDDKYLAHIN